MKKITIATLSFMLLQTVQAECVPAREVIELPDDLPYVGRYHRVHPSGNYVLASASSVNGSDIVIFDITDPANPKIVPTKMKNEAYPVEGSWKLIASPYDDGGMNYYEFDKVLENKRTQTSSFVDQAHDQFYHSSAEFSDSKSDKLHFRTMLWQGGLYKDYTVVMGADGVKNVKKGEQKRACSNLTQNLSAPILSKDGNEVATNHGGTTQVYKINADNTCDLVEDFGFRTGKVNFSYPQAGTLGNIVFEGTRSVVINGVPTQKQGVFSYNRDTKETNLISSLEDGSPGYPGMAKDGRVVYVDRTNRQVIRVDPNQINADGSANASATSCIQKAGSENSSNDGKVVPRVISQ